MAAQNGKDLLIKVDVSGTFETLAGLRATRISFNAVGGMKVLRIRCRAISRTASSGSYLWARWANTVTP